MDVKLIVPNFGFRGRIMARSELQFTVEKVGPRFPVVSGPHLEAKVKSVLRRERPDFVLVANGNLFKPYLIRASLEIPCAVKLYCYEMMCPMSFGLMFRNGKICEYNFLKYPFRCALCLDDKRRIVSNPDPERAEFLRSFAFLYPVYHRLVEKSLTVPAGFIATSLYMKSRFREAIDDSRITVIPEGVEAGRFVPVTKRPDQVKRVFFPGRTWDAMKGFDVLIRACRMLSRKRKDFRVCVSGSERPGFSYPSFVEFLGWVSESDLPITYGTSDVVVIPSIWPEPFGLSGLEAMSCAVPVLASRTGGIVDFIEHEEDGLLVEPGDHIGLCEQLDYILDDEDERHRLGNNARKKVLGEYAWPKITDRYVNLFKRMVSE